PAIIASASTVIIALLMLSFAQLGSTKGMGPVLAIGVGVGMLAMLTLLPALMVTFPRGIFWPYRPAYGSAEPTTCGLWARGGLGRAGRGGPGAAGRLAHPAPPPDHVDHHRRDPGRAGARADRAEGQRPDQRAILPRPPRLGGRWCRARRPLPGRRGRARRGHR